MLPSGHKGQFTRSLFYQKGRSPKTPEFRTITDIFLGSVAFTSNPLDIQDPSTFSDEIRNDNSGTTTKPIFVGCSRWQTGKGGHFLLKIGSIYYPVNLKHVNKSNVSLRCRKYKYGCKFKSVLEILNTNNKEAPGFYERNNFEVKATDTDPHTCQGYGSKDDPQNDPLVTMYYEQRMGYPTGKMINFEKGMPK